MFQLSRIVYFGFQPLTISFQLIYVANTSTLMIMMWYGGGLGIRVEIDGLVAMFGKDDKVN